MHQIDRAVGCRERAAGIDRIGDQRRQDAGDEGRAEQKTLQQLQPAPHADEVDGKHEEISECEERVCNTDVDR